MPEETVTGQVAQEQPVSEPIQTSVKVDFKSLLSDEFRENPVLSKFNDVNELAKEHLNAQSLIGRKGILKPKENDEADLARYKKEIGVPDKWEDYANPSIEVPNELKEFFSEDKINLAKKLAHEAGVPKEAAEKLIAKYLEAEVSEYSELFTRDKAAFEAANKELKERFGLAYNQKIEAANNLAKQIGQSPQEQDFINKNLNDPAFVGILSRMGELVEGDKIAKGSFVKLDTPKEIQSKIDELTKPESAYWNYDKKFTPQQHSDAVTEVTRLYTLLKQSKAQ